MTKQTQNKECCEKCANSSWLGLNGKCWHICHKLEPKPQEQNWEIEFEKEFCDEDRPDWITGTQRAWPIKSFIRNLLASQKEKIKEEAEFELKKLQDMTAWSEGYQEGARIQVEMDATTASEFREKIMRELEGMKKPTPYTFELEKDPAFEREQDAYNQALFEIVELIRNLK